MSKIKFTDNRLLSEVASFLTGGSDLIFNWSKSIKVSVSSFSILKNFPLQNCILTTTKKKANRSLEFYFIINSFK